MTVQAVDANGKWVGVCGNMAADPDLACILLDPMPHRVGLTLVDAEFVAALRGHCNDRHVPEFTAGSR